MHNERATRMKIAFPFVAALTLVFSGCLFLDGTDTPDPDDGLTIIGQGQNWPKLDEFEIKEAIVSGDILTLKVAYSGGCREHAFTFYSTGPVLKTLPPGADVWVLHDANGDMCEAFISETISVSLRPIRAVGYNEVLVHVLDYDLDGFTTVTYSY